MSRWRSGNASAAVLERETGEMTRWAGFRTAFRESTDYYELLLIGVSESCPSGADVFRTGLSGRGSPPPDQSEHSTDALLANTPPDATFHCISTRFDIQNRNKLWIILSGFYWLLWNHICLIGQIGKPIWFNRLVLVYKLKLEKEFLCQILVYDRKCNSAVWLCFSLLFKQGWFDFRKPLAL